MFLFHSSNAYSPFLYLFVFILCFVFLFLLYSFYIFFFFSFRGPSLGFLHSCNIFNWVKTIYSIYTHILSISSRKY